MVKKKFLITVLIIFSVSIKVFPQAKVGTTSFQFLDVMTSARGTALGESYGSVVDNSEAVFWNPAALTKVKNMDISIGYTQWIFGVNHYSFAGAYTIGRWGTIGLQALYTDIGDIEVTRVDALGFIGDTYNPGLTGQIINPHQYVVGISYAKDLTDKFAFGLTAKYAKEDLIVMSKGTVCFDGGFTFNTGYRSVKIAASIRNFGPEIKYVNTSYPLPQTFNIGISGYLFSPTEGLLMNIPNQSLLLTFDLIQPRDYNQQNSVGLEYSFDDLVYLRGGYKFNGDQQGMAAGVGIKYNGYRLDYSYSNYGSYLGNVHRFTVGFELK